MKKIPYLAEAFVQVLQDARYHARMSQEDLARSVGCARSFISFIETKNNLPSLNAFMAMAEALDVPPDELLRRVQSRIRSIENARDQLGDNPGDTPGTPEALRPGKAKWKQ